MSELAKQSKPITHPELVRALAKPGPDIADELGDHLEHKVVLIQEAIRTVNQAERLDKAKKQAVYNKLQGIRATGINLADVSDPYVKTHIDAKQADLLHMAIGIAGEAGELLDAVLSHILNAEPLDLENVIEELGDLEFYSEGLRQNQNITREETISHNISKLSVRYGSGTYSDAQAQDRADKTGD